MRRTRLVWAVLLACFAHTSKSALAATALGDSLPVPRGLEGDVAFWEKVFTKVTPDQCMFHDKDDLGRVYFVKALPGESPAERTRAGRRYLNAIRLAMKHLGDGGKARNLLERRIVQVTPAGERHPATYRAMMDNVRCQRGVDLIPSLERSRKYVTMVKRVLKQNNVPDDIAYLPHLESGFNVQAYSRAGARGIWQIMPATGRLAGMRVTRQLDHRVDPYRSTRVAAKLLSDLYGRTGSWPLAITGYNYGPNGIARAVKAHGADYMTVRERHKTRIFGFAARNYYPSFLAVRNVAMEFEKAPLRVAESERKNATKLAF